MTRSDFYSFIVTTVDIVGEGGYAGYGPDVNMDHLFFVTGRQWDSFCTNVIIERNSN